MTHEPALESLPLELAETRPDMIYLWFLGGVPVKVAALLFLVAGLITTTAGVRWALWAPLAWWGMSRLMAKDYHASTCIGLYLQISHSTLDKREQGGFSATPLPTNNRVPRGIV